MNNSSIINSTGWLRMGEIEPSSTVLNVYGNTIIKGWLFSYSDLLVWILLGIFGIAIIYLLIKVSQNQRKTK